MDALIYLPDEPKPRHVSQYAAERVIAYLLTFTRLRPRTPRWRDVAIYSIYHKRRKIGEYCRNRGLIDYVVIG